MVFKTELEFSPSSSFQQLFNMSEPRAPTSALYVKEQVFTALAKRTGNKVTRIMKVCLQTSNTLYTIKKEKRKKTWS